MKPLTTIDDDGREFVAVGLVPMNGNIVWVPAGTEIVVSPIVEEADEPYDEPEPGVKALNRDPEADPTMPKVSAIIVPS